MIGAKRTPGRRSWEVHLVARVGFFVALCLLGGSMWFLHGRVKLLEAPHNPHFETAHCFDCHESMGSKMKAEQCFECHDNKTRELLAGAVEKRKAQWNNQCSHPLKLGGSKGRPAITALCLSCHRTIKGYVAMIDISTSRYVEIDMCETHPIGLMPTESIYPKTLPLDRITGAINCVTCHDPHSTDRRLKTLRYYYPGNGRPADFRPLCLDCHIDGWLPLKRMKPARVMKAERP